MLLPDACKRPVQALLLQTSASPLQPNTQHLCTLNKPWSSPWSEMSSHTWSVANTKITHLFFSRRKWSPKQMHSSLVRLVYRAYNWCPSECSQQNGSEQSPWKRRRNCAQNIAPAGVTKLCPRTREKKKPAAMRQVPRLFAMSQHAAQMPLSATEPRPKQFTHSSATKGAKTLQCPIRQFPLLQNVLSTVTVQYFT